MPRRAERRSTRRGTHLSGQVMLRCVWVRTRERPPLARWRGGGRRSRLQTLLVLRASCRACQIPCVLPLEAGRLSGGRVEEQRAVVAAPVVEVEHVVQRAGDRVEGARDAAQAPVVLDELQDAALVRQG